MEVHDVERRGGEREQLIVAAEGEEARWLVLVVAERTLGALGAP
jgi:hypothetical protein